MFEEMNEKISVIGLYKNCKFIPKMFFLKNRNMPVEEVTLINNIKDGLTKKRQYSVTSGNNVYRLIFNRDDESWCLTGVYMG